MTSLPSSPVGVMHLGWMDAGLQYRAYSCRKQKYVMIVVPRREKVPAIREEPQPLSSLWAAVQGCGTNNSESFPIVTRLNPSLPDDPAVHRR